MDKRRISLADQPIKIMVFCKAPVPGTVKTRLQPDYTAEHSAEIHSELATHTLHQVMALAAMSDGAIIPELWCSPDTSHPFYQRFAIQKLAQEGENLGVRMAHAFDQANSPALLIGTDCPGLTADYLLQATQQLQVHEVVISPAEDGGYGLIGLQQSNAALFEAINWGTDRVYQQTCEKLSAQQLSWHPLAKIWDVDYPADVERWRRG